MEGGAARGVLRQAEWAIGAPAFGSTFSPEKVEKKIFIYKNKSDLMNHSEYTQTVFPKVFLTGMLLVLPIAVSAEQTHEWTFSTTNALEGWSGQGQAETLANGNGLHIKALGDSFLTRENNVGFPIDGFYLTYSTNQNTQIGLVWNAEGATDGTLTQLQLFLPASAEPTTIPIDPTFIPNWTGNPLILGFYIPAGSDFTIQSLQAKKYNILEKGMSILTGFWKQDRVTAATVNFLWGPRMTLTPIEREELFLSVPPHVSSANWLFYGVMVFVLGVAFVVKKRGTQVAGIVLITVFGGLWILYDVRMGVENLGQLQHDLQTYIGIEPAEAEFRNVGHVIALAEAVNAQEDASYILVPSSRYPLLGQLRYFTFPKRPLLPEEPDAHGATLWAVLDRPDISVENGALIMNGQVLSQSGSLLEEVAPHTFLYRSSL